MRTILIATGDEITQGDIVNTTGPAIAQKLAEHNIAIVQHIMVPDNETAIQDAIQYAIANADLIFTTGGLGPTSDDLTRFALAKALNQPLVFNEQNWQAIQERLSAYKLIVHESNRQQAYFPEGAEIFPNANGTAAGCMCETDGKKIFMLPGPPNECLTMFNKFVVPMLPKDDRFKLHWLLLGASEGEIAAELDAVLSNIDCQTGYRAEYPYLEIKVWTHSAQDLAQCEKLFEPIVEKYLVSKHNQPASTQLREQLIAQDKTISIFDSATGGVLQSVLQTPETLKLISFNVGETKADIKITGLSEFWHGTPAPGHDQVVLEFADQKLTRKLYYRNKTVRNFVCEWVCWQLLQL